MDKTKLVKKCAFPNCSSHAVNLLEDYLKNKGFTKEEAYERIAIEDIVKSVNINNDKDKFNQLQKQISATDFLYFLKYLTILW